MDDASLSGQAIVLIDPNITSYSFIYIIPKRADVIHDENTTRVGLYRKEHE